MRLAPHRATCFHLRTATMTECAQHIAFEIRTRESSIQLAGK